MTDPDHHPPVFLPEPERPRPEAPSLPQPRRSVHPDWDAVLGPDETVLWDGKPQSRAALTGKNRSFAVFAMAAIFGFAAISSQSPIPIVIGLVAFFLLRKRTRKSREAPDRSYLLTNRAAYLAQVSGPRLLNIHAFPITRDLRLGLGPRSVSFASKIGKNGSEVAEGFLDIPDAQHVHDLIRDIQKAKA